MYKKIFLFLIILSLSNACSSTKSAMKATPPFNAELSFKQANEKIKTKYYEDARKILEDIKVQDTSGEYTPLARIRIGDSYFEERLYEEAVIEYERFLEMHPYHKYSYYAQYQLAMSYFKRVDTVDTSYGFAQRALEEFEKLKTVYPRNPYIDIVANRIKTCKNILAEYEFYVGQFYFKKGSYDSAIGRFNLLLQNYPDSKKEPETLYYLGLSYKNLGNTEKAKEILTALIGKYPTNRESLEAKRLITSLK